MNGVITHKSKSNIYKCVSDAGSIISSAFTARDDGEIFDDTNKTNISSYLINGATVTLPFPLTRDEKYTVTINKNNSNLSSTLYLKSRRAVDKETVINFPVLLSEEVQGTVSVYMHPSVNKMTVVNSALINSSNYTADFTFAVDPRTVVDLPAVSGFVWCTGFWDYLTDRLIMIGRPTTTQSSGGNFKMCAYHIVGDKAGQVWNLAATVQNSFNTIATDTWTTAEIFPVVDYNRNMLYVQGNRKYGISLTNMLGTWEYDASNKTLLTSDVLLRKYGYYFNEGRFLSSTCFQSFADMSRLYNMFINSETSGVGVDNVNGYVYKGSGNPSGLKMFSGNTLIAEISGSVYDAKLILPASAARRMLVAKMGSYSTHPKMINIYDLDSKTIIRSETTITDTNSTNYLDGDYLNSIGMFALLTTGTAATSGVRTVHFISKDYDGTNPLLKYKLLLDYDSTYMFTNRKRY